MGRHVADLLEDLGLFVANRIDDARPVAARALNEASYRGFCLAHEILSVSRWLSGVAASIRRQPAPQRTPITNDRINCTSKGQA